MWRTHRDREWWKRKEAIYYLQLVVILKNEPTDGLIFNWKAFHGCMSVWLFIVDYLSKKILPASNASYLTSWWLHFVERQMRGDISGNRNNWKISLKAIEMLLTNSNKFSLGLMGNSCSWVGNWLMNMRFCLFVCVFTSSFKNKVWMWNSSLSTNALSWVIHFLPLVHFSWTQTCSWGHVSSQNYQWLS